MGAFVDVPVIAATAGKESFLRQFKIDFHAHVEGYKQYFPKFDIALKSSKLTMPAFWFEKEFQLGSGESELIVRQTGGHSVCSSYAYFKKEGIIVAGDNVQADYYPYFGDPTGDMKVWIKTLKEWETMNVSFICPGHGPSIDSVYLKSIHVFLEELYVTLVKLKKENTSEEEMLNYSGFPKGYWPEELSKPIWYDPSLVFVYKSIKVDE